MSVERVVRDYLCDILGIEPQRVVRDATLESLGLDSFGKAELFLSISEALDMEMPIELIESIRTIHDLISWTEQWAKE